MQAISVKFNGPTNTRGAAWTATTTAKTVRVAQDYELDPFQNAARAALMLCEQLGWAGILHGGTLKDGRHVFVFDNGNNAFQAVGGIVKSTDRARRNRTGRRTRSRR